MLKKGFTFIEMIVVLTIIVLIIPTVFVILFSITNVATKTYRLAVTKREGDYLLNIITNNIRNRAITIHSAVPADVTNFICNDISNPVPYNSTSLYFKDRDGNTFGYFLDGDKFASYSSYLLSGPTPTGTPTPAPTNAPIALISSSLIVQNFSIGCETSAAYSYPTVLIAFDICYKTSSGDCYAVRSEEGSILHYTTRLRLRNSY